MDKIAERLAELSDKFGPHVIEAVRGAARMEALSCMAGGAMALVIALLILRKSLKVWRTEKLDEFYYALSGLGIATGTIIAFAGLWSFVDPWVWATLYNPDLWIAKKVIKL